MQYRWFAQNIQAGFLICPYLLDLYMDYARAVGLPYMTI